MKEYWDAISGNLFMKGILLAVFGGFVRVAIHFKGKKIRLYEIFTGMLAASFVGVLIMHLIEYYKIDQAMAGFLAGGAGFMHSEMISLLRENHSWFGKSFRKLFSEKDENGKS